MPQTADTNAEVRTPTARAQRQTNRRLDIQGLRALAVLFVVCFHSGLPVPGGFVGVDVFFVISGFVITAMLTRERQVSGRTSFANFYARRFRRLTPALAVMVSITVLLAGLLLSPLQGQQNTGKTGLGAVFLSANVVISQTTGGYFDAAADQNPLLHTWSLSVEEQFYLLFPLALAIGWTIMRNRGQRNSGAVLIATAIGLVSFAAAVYSSRGYQLPHAVVSGFYSPFTRAWEFAAGALLAFAGMRASAPRAGIDTAAGILGIAALAASLWIVTGSTPFPGPATLLPVLGAVLVIHAGGSPANPVSRVLACRGLVAIGDLSYSWYLWHWPLIAFSGFLWPGSSVALLIAAFVSLGPATASYRWVEQPIRRLRTPGRKRMARIVAFTILVPTAISLSLLVSVDHAFWSKKVKDLRGVVIPLHAAAVNGCTTGDPTNHDASRCRWNAREAGPPVYVVGDSNADQFSEAVIGAGRLEHRRVAIFAFNGCAFIGAWWSDESDPQRAVCRRYVHDSISWLEQAPHGLVIIGMSDSLWVAPGVAAGPTRATETSDHRKKARYLESDLLSTVMRLRKAGQQVLLIQPIPKATRVIHGRLKLLLDPERCSVLTVVAGGCPKPVETPRSYEDRMQAEPRAAIRRAASTTGSRILDLRDYFCPAGVCSTHRGGVLMYRDAGHISVKTSGTLASRFASAIRYLR